MEYEELIEEIKELKARISELEGMMETMMMPISEMKASTRKYLRLVELALRNGSISPDMLTPEIKDPISKDILCVLVEKGGLNISQIAEGVKARKGSSSRKTIREKLVHLQEQDIVVKNSDKKVPTYHITDEVLRKWSKLLGIAI